MPFLDKNKVKLFYKTYGETGPWVALINGYSRPSTDFRAFAVFLQEKGFRVLLFDNRGAGLTEYEELTSLEDIAEDLKTLLEHLKISSIHLVGFSLGSVVARIFVHKNPEYVQRFCLVSPPADISFLGSEKDPGWGKTVEEIEAKFSNYVSEDFYKRNKVLIHSMAKAVFDKMESGFLDKSLDQREALKNTPGSFYSIKSVEKDILILQGALDQITPLSHAEAFAHSSPRAEFIVFDGAAHLLLIEKGKELFSSVAHFLAAFR